MEKDIDRIPKNPETDIVIRIDDFGGKTGLTIREFVKSERYTGFTKAGTRIPAEYIKQFKEAIAGIDENDLSGGEGSSVESESPSSDAEDQRSSGHRNKDASSEESEGANGVAKEVGQVEEGPIENVSEEVM